MHPGEPRPARPDHVVARTEHEVIAAVRDADAAGVPWVIMGGAAEQRTCEDHGGALRTVQVATRGVKVNDDGCEVDALAYCGGVQVSVAAGESWQDFVVRAVTSEWVGVERLGDYSGTVGGATVRNVRAYGQSVSDTVAAVRTWDRAGDEYRRFAMVDCHFGEEGSRFSVERMADGSARYVLLEVDFLLRQSDLTDPIRDPELARMLRVELGQRALLAQAREAVLASSRAKGRTSDGETT